MHNFFCSTSQCWNLLSSCTYRNRNRIIVLFIDDSADDIFPSICSIFVKWEKVAQICKHLRSLSPVEIMYVTKWSEELYWEFPSVGKKGFAYKVKNDSNIKSFKKFVSKQNISSSLYLLNCNYILRILSIK